MVGEAGYYPLPALRELLLNAVVHRDYTSPVDIQIKIFDNAVTFFNPGKLFGDLTIEKLKSDDYQSRTRNKLVAFATGRGRVILTFVVLLFPTIFLIRIGSLSGRCRGQRYNWGIY